MATKTMGTNGTTTLTDVVFSTSLLDADVATIQQSIYDDIAFGGASINNATAGPGSGLTPTGTLNSSTSITSVSSTTGVAIGQWIWAIGIPAGTQIIAVTTNTITLSNAATSSGAGVQLYISGKPPLGGFAKNGLLYVPNRGVLRVLPGDYVAVDASGWPILVSYNAITVAGSSWTHT